MKRKLSDIVGHPLMPDFFLDEATPEELQHHVKGKVSKKAGSKEESKGSSAAGGGAVTHVFDQLRKALNPELIQQMQATYAFKLTGMRVT